MFSFVKIRRIQFDAWLIINQFIHHLNVIKNFNFCTFDFQLFSLIGRISLLPPSEKIDENHWYHHHHQNNKINNHFFLHTVKESNQNSFRMFIFWIQQQQPKILQKTQFFIFLLLNIFWIVSLYFSFIIIKWIFLIPSSSSILIDYEHCVCVCLFG